MPCTQLKKLWVCYSRLSITRHKHTKTTSCGGHSAPAVASLGRLPSACVCLRRSKCWNGSRRVRRSSQMPQFRTSCTSGGKSLFRRQKALFKMMTSTPSKFNWNTIYMMSILYLRHMTHKADFFLSLRTRSPQR